MNVRLIIAIITSLIDEVIILAIILFVLPHFNIHIPWWGIALIVIAFLVYAVGTFIIGTRILKKKPLPGFTDMIGTEGRVSSAINPKGYVKIEGELWEARSESGPIDKGADVVVIAQDGFKLVVRKKDK
jgi:membrane-bound ClpP family serine protease